MDIRLDSPEQTPEFCKGVIMRIQLKYLEAAALFRNVSCFREVQAKVKAVSHTHAPDLLLCSFTNAILAVSRENCC
jgi:hypothetical protein